MLKKRVITIVSCLIMLIVSLYVFERANEILIRKTSRNRMEDLIQGETNKDILFMGTSHIMDGVIPIELWEEYGYTSYILCSEYNDMDRYVPMLRLALQYTKPKLVVLDVDNYWEKSPADNVLNGYHDYADAFPLTKEKVKTTCELYQDEEIRRELLFPIVRYHERWKDLSRGDFRKHGSDGYLKGYEFSTEMQEVELYPVVGREEGILYDSYGLSAMEKLIALCKEEGIEVLLMTTPFNADTQEQQFLQGMHQFADAQGVSYVNLIEENMLDPTADYRDDGHLNVFGAQKVTAFMGNYISERYDIPDRSEDTFYKEKWNGDYQEYLAFVTEQIENSEG